MTNSPPCSSSSSSSSSFLSTTPADLIAAVLNLSLDSFEIQTNGISDVTITSGPRYEQNRNKEWESTKHRATTLKSSEGSSIRCVDSFHLQGTDLSTTRSFEIITNHYLTVFITTS